MNSCMILQERWTQKSEKSPVDQKVCANNDQLRLQPPPQMAHASRLDQHSFMTIAQRTTNHISRI